MSYKNMRAVVSKYTAKDGSEKTQWGTIGRIFFGENGKISGNLDMVPTNWDGHFILVDPMDDKQAPAQGAPAQAPAQSPSRQGDLPF